MMAVSKIVKKGVHYFSHHPIFNYFELLLALYTASTRSEAIRFISTIIKHSTKSPIFFSKIEFVNIFSGYIILNLKRISLVFSDKLIPA